MQTTKQLLRAVKTRHNLGSDGSLARTLGLTRGAVSAFMCGKAFLGHDTALRVAELLDLAPDYVIACAEAERAHTDRTRAYWRNAAERAAALAACVLLAVISVFFVDSESFNNGLQISMLAAIPTKTLCIMSN